MQNDTDFINYFDIDKYENFKSQTNDDLIVSTTEEKQVLDYSWIDVIEPILIYLDNIIRNPRKFIIPEEEILIIEKTKKVNQETVKHLAQHAQLIQDVEADGEVKPKKLLNAQKEETYDIYENRFIITLVKRLSTFIELKSNENKYYGNVKNNKKINYNAKSTFKSETVNINLSLERIKSHKEYNVTDNIESINKRIFDMKVIVNSFLNTNFLKSLSQAAPVQSPIRKTNVILNDTNFQQAVKLWEYLDEVERHDFTKVEQTTTKDQDLELAKKFLVTYFLNYDNLDKKIDGKNNSDKKLQEIKRLISEYALQSSVTSLDFQKELLSEFTQIRKREEKINNAIYKNCIQFVNGIENKINKIYNILQ